MRIGIFGGTFDPVHYGHLLLAETCREQLRLDEVRFVPAATPPHKLHHEISDGSVRADMLGLAVAGYPEFVVDQRELKRKGPSYTVDTLTEFTAEFPGAELYFLTGADSLRDFLTWREPERIINLATLVACNRPGLPALDNEQVVHWVGPRIADRILTLQMAGTDISGSEMRERVRDGRSLRFLTPRAVEAFIIEHDLYTSRVCVRHFLVAEVARLRVKSWPGSEFWRIRLHLIAIRAKYLAVLRNNTRFWIDGFVVHSIPLV